MGLSYTPPVRVSRGRCEGRLPVHGHWRHRGCLGLLGWTIRYVAYCEDARTPGLLGQIKGVTDYERKEVKIGLKANPTDYDQEHTLQHELHHIQDPTWDCGNRDVLGRGGPSIQRKTHEATAHHPIKR